MAVSGSSVYFLIVASMNQVARLFDLHKRLIIFLFFSKLAGANSLLYLLVIGLLLIVIVCT